MKNQINRASEACCAASGRVGVAISGGPIAECNSALRSARVISDDESPTLPQPVIY